MKNQISNVALDILLLLISLFGWFHVFTSLGVFSSNETQVPEWLMLYWAVFSVPVLLSLMGRKQIVWVWKLLFLLGLMVIAVEGYSVTSVLVAEGTRLSDIISPPFLLFATSFSMATFLMVYRAYIGSRSDAEK